jgi:hypothetical protein
MGPKRDRVNGGEVVELRCWESPSGAWGAWVGDLRYETKDEQTRAKLAASAPTLAAENERMRKVVDWVEEQAGFDCAEYDKHLSPYDCYVRGRKPPCISCQARKALEALREGEGEKV